MLYEKNGMAIQHSDKDRELQIKRNSFDKGEVVGRTNATLQSIQTRIERLTSSIDEIKKVLGDLPCVNHATALSAVKVTVHYQWVLLMAVMATYVSLLSLIAVLLIKVFA